MIRVVFVGGQSNATGWYSPSELLSDEYKQPTGIKTFDGSKFVDFDYSNGNISNRNVPQTNFGLDLMFGLKFREEYPDDDLYFVKYSIGGATISQLIPHLHELYTRALNNLRGQEYEVSGFIWFQGESDMHKLEDVKSYAGKLQSIINGIKPRKTIIVRPGLLGSFDYELEWREMIEDFCNKNNYIMLSADYVEYPEGGGIHVHGNGLLRLGIKAINKYIGINKYDENDFIRIDDKTQLGT